MIKLRVRTPKRWGGDEVPKGMEREVIQMLEAIGINAGAFKLKMNKRVKGSPHTKGVRASQANGKSILLHIQPGDNATRYSAWLYSPPEMDTQTLFEKIRFGEEKDELLKETGMAEEKPEAKELIAEPLPCADVIPPALEGLTKIRGFAKDELQVALALMSVQERMKKGPITGGECISAIQEGCGFEKFTRHMINPILGSLVKRKYMGRFGVRGAHTYLLTAQGEALINRYQNQTNIHTEAAESVKRPTVGEIISTEDLLNQVGQVKKDVEKYAAVKNRLAELEKEANELRDVLLNPDIAQAVKKWEAIKKILASR